MKKNKKTEEDFKVYGYRGIFWLSKKEHIPRNHHWINLWKLYVPKAIGSGNMQEDVIKPIVGEPRSVSTETYLLIGPFDSEEVTMNVYSYIQTKFFHFLFGLRKITQNTTAKVYSFIPMQDFSKPWTDKELYKKYKLTEEEIEYIEKSVRDLE